MGTGLPWTFIRPAYFMQNLLMMAPGIRKTRSFSLPAADAAVAQVDTRDVAAVMIRVLVEGGHDGAAYDITGPEPFTWFEAAEMVSAVAGAPVSYEPVAPEAYRRQLEGRGAPAWMVEALDELFALFGAGAGLRTTDHIRSITNQAPRSFAVFARDHADAFRIA
jgi:uncharacterized protein YbjT (DUF2867 family)